MVVRQRERQNESGHRISVDVSWAQLAARQRGSVPADDEAAAAFSREVWSEVVRLTGKVILSTALGDARGARDDSGLIDAVCRGEGRIVVEPGA